MNQGRVGVLTKRATVVSKELTEGAVRTFEALACKIADLTTRANDRQENQDAPVRGTLVSDLERMMMTYHVRCGLGSKVNEAKWPKQISLDLVSARESLSAF